MSAVPSPVCEPRWRLFDRADPRHLQNPAVRRWLLRDGSLTAALTQLALGDLRVRVLRQCLAPLRLSEARALGVRFPSQALVREVVLSGQGEDWIFARSLIAITQMTGDLRRLRVQGQTPLGHFLFRHRDLSRTPFAIARVTAAHNYVPKCLLGAEPLLARRSVFSLGGHSLLVSEVYLPALIARINALN